MIPPRRGCSLLGASGRPVTFAWVPAGVQRSKIQEWRLLYGPPQSPRNDVNKFGDDGVRRDGKALVPSGG
eukprot:5573076-Lingulodinium_polyedra.AAC.1